MNKLRLVCLLALLASACYSQNPTFGNEILVTINGYTLDAMEPFLSPDGNAMFFNSLNDGNSTSLYYAAKVNDSTFNLVGLVPVVNQTVTPRLDGVASLDTANNFYWVSTRGYPSDFDNLHRIRFLQTGYTNFGRVHGTIYIYNPGWIIMDAAVNYCGDKLIYCNAFFNNCNFGLPCISVLNMAQKQNDSTFNKTANSASILVNVNDTSNYIVYAPQLSKDELELYYTRALKNIPQTEICVSVRNSTNAPFSSPSVVVPMSSSIPEGPTLSTDKSNLYYHRKSGAQFKLFLRKKTGATSLSENTISDQSLFFPNPNRGILNFSGSVSKFELLDLQGRLMMDGSGTSIDLSGLTEGIYLLRLQVSSQTVNRKLILTDN